MDSPEPAFEPFRIKSVEPLGFTTRAEREAALSEAGGNPSLVPAGKVLIDLLDAGGPVPASQLAPITAAGGAGKVFLSNAHSDSSRESVAAAGSRAEDLPVPDALVPALAAPFKGDIDLRALEMKARELGPRLAMVVMTLTNDALGGQPASLANLRAAREISRHYKVPLFLDASRLAENAWFIKLRERGHGSRSAADIGRELFSYCDGAWASGAGSGDAPEEPLDERLLSYRIASVERFAERLRRAGVPIVEPAGGHAVIVDAGRLLERLPSASRVLSAEIYLEGGVRAAASSAAGREWVRLSVPRRAYTESQLAHAASVVGAAAARAGSLLAGLEREAAA